MIERLQLTQEGIYMSTADFYEEFNFGGEPDLYTAPANINLTHGPKNDKYKSLKVGFGLKVTCYQHGQGSGNHKVYLEGEYPDIDKDIHGLTTIKVEHIASGVVAEADTYVKKEGDSEYANFGRDIELKINKDNEYSFIKFNIEHLNADDFTIAQVGLNVSSDVSDSDSVILIQEIDSSWEENYLNYHDGLQYKTNPENPVDRHIVSTGTSLIEVDITDIVKNALNNHESSVSIMLSNETDASKTVVIHSRESSIDLGPRLVIL